MLQKTEKYKELLDSKGWKIFTLSAFSLILPVCFYLSIFDEPLFNKTIIMIGFTVFCIYIFSWRKPAAPVSYVDRFVVLMVVAACLTTLRASDLMADQQVIVGRRAGDSSVGRLKYWNYALTVVYPARPLISKIFGNGFYTSTVMHLTPVVMDNQPAIDNAFITILYEQGFLGYWLYSVCFCEQSDLFGT